MVRHPQHVMREQQPLKLWGARVDVVFVQSRSCCKPWRLVTEGCVSIGVGVTRNLVHMTGVRRWYTGAGTAWCFALFRWRP